MSIGALIRGKGFDWLNGRVATLRSRPRGAEPRRGGSFRHTLFISSSLTVVGSVADVLPAWANPQGGTVQAGNATIQQTSPSRINVIQSSDKAVINWQGFSIQQGEQTNFQQPSSQSMILNRVTGNLPSSIMGQLTSNGHVVLVNPNGVLFGATAQVNVGSLTATTANISNANFMAGKLTFDQPSASGGTVVNQGQITVQEGGLVALVAPGVANSGVINARLGKVSMVSSNTFAIDLYGDQLIQFAVDGKVLNQVQGADGKPLLSLVNNSGQIIADGGQVQLSANAARGIVDHAINMSGIVRSRSVGQKNGEIILSAGDGDSEVSGTLEASGKGQGQTGGTVQVTGNTVALRSGASIDVSGSAGGGTALIGGDFRGGKATAQDYAQYAIIPPRKPVSPAQQTVVEKGATINADALDSGKGGEVVVWANDSTSFSGSISARGGVNGGDGGFAEVSGHNTLSFDGLANLSAPFGKAGTILFDPTDIVIDSAAAAAIEAILNTGTAVTEQADNSISINSSILKTAGSDTSLTFTSNYLTIANNVIIGSSSGKLNVSFNIAKISDDDYTSSLMYMFNAITGHGDLSSIKLITTYTGSNAGTNYYAISSTNISQLINLYSQYFSDQFTSSQAYKTLVASYTSPSIGQNVKIITNGGGFLYNQWSYSFTGVSFGSGLEIPSSDPNSGCRGYFNRNCGATLSFHNSIIDWATYNGLQYTLYFVTFGSGYSSMNINQFLSLNTAPPPSPPPPSNVSSTGNVSTDAGLNQQVSQVSQNSPVNNGAPAQDDPGNSDFYNDYRRRQQANNQNDLNNFLNPPDTETQPPQETTQPVAPTAQDNTPSDNSEGGLAKTVENEGEYLHAMGELIESKIMKSLGEGLAKTGTFGEAIIEALKGKPSDAAGTIEGSIVGGAVGDAMIAVVLVAAEANPISISLGIALSLAVSMSSSNLVKNIVSSGGKILFGLSHS